MAAIKFYSEDTSFKLNGRRVLRDWIRNVVEQHHCTCGEIAIVICSDAFLLNINQQFLHHDEFTDIVTFDYCEQKMVSGDLFISIDRVRENSLKHKVTLNEELHRVIIHGVLHLLGFKDKTPDAKIQMTREENKMLDFLEF